MNENTQRLENNRQNEQIRKLSDQVLKKVTGGCPTHYIEPNDPTIQKPKPKPKKNPNIDE